MLTNATHDNQSIVLCNALPKIQGFNQGEFISEELLTPLLPQTYLIHRATI